MGSKKWYESKTLWVNGIAGIAAITQAVMGEAIIDAEAQVGILALVNLVLRLITSKEIA
jgi:hypothetical protein